MYMINSLPQSHAKVTPARIQSGQAAWLQCWWNPVSQRTSATSWSAMDGSGHSSQGRLIGRSFCGTCWRLMRLSG